MDNKLIKEFDSVSQRAIYGLNLMYSEFEPIESSSADEGCQARLHGLMGRMIGRLYENPMLLGLPGSKDEAFQKYELNNMNPGLDKIYQSMFKSLYEFYRFLYMSALHGGIQAESLFVGNEALKIGKAPYKTQYGALLGEVGIIAAKDKEGVTLAADNSLLRAMKLLAEKVPVNVSPWTPFALINFAACSFTGSFGYLLPRADSINNLGGMLIGLEKRCLEKGYATSIECSMTLTDLGFAIVFKRGVGGFSIGYRARKYQQFQFGTLNGIGEKAMIEDFGNLDTDMQTHFINICRICNQCLGCTKNGKNQVFTVNVEYKDKSYSLCPSFPNHSWDTIDENLISLLFKYHDAQERYGTDWKKK